MTLDVDVALSRGSFHLDARFETGGRLTALFGPSGSGKSTVVDLIAGMARPDRGRIRVGDAVLVDTDRRIFVPAHRRRIGYVFQDARLFPHLSVSQNLRYGRFFAPAAGRYADFDAIVALLGIGHLLDRRPSGLSGGARPRVAIGRALLASPRLILMDEPLASLDDARKAEIMPYIERLRDEVGIPIVLVSHSVAEVARLATDMVVLANGVVTAAGPTGEILRRLDILPAGERAEGGSLLAMTVERAEDGYGLTVLAGPAGEVFVPAIDRPAGATVRVRVRARDVTVTLDPPSRSSALNVLHCSVSAIETGEGAHADVTLDCGGQPLLARLTRRSVAQLELAPGMSAFAVLKSVGLEGAASGGV